MSRRPPQPEPSLPLDCYVAVSMLCIPGREDRYGKTEWTWETNVAWESAGTLEFCRSCILEWEMEPAYICRITGGMEVVELCEHGEDEDESDDEQLPLFTEPADATG